MRAGRFSLSLSFLADPSATRCIGFDAIILFESERSVTDILQPPGTSVISPASFFSLVHASRIRTRGSLIHRIIQTTSTLFGIHLSEPRPSDVPGSVLFLRRGILDAFPDDTERGTRASRNLSRLK
ncbi:hypothetical protein DFH06DRAFT_362751 [Mycena polygramma]|nr:hypothetical protein DFH06DRAFT_362751 [Mycena polygramma]